MKVQVKFRVIVDGKKIYGFQWVDERGFWCWCYENNQDQWEYGIIDYSLLGDDGFEGKIKWEQFTGLTDKSGVEIYEGDILEDIKKRRWIVQFKEGIFTASYQPTDTKIILKDLLSFYGGAKIIGNIHGTIKSKK